VAKKDDNQSNLQDLQQQIDELTADLQRVSADFANFKRRSDDERQQLSQTAKMTVIGQLLPLFDNIERALSHMPAELKDNQWAKGVAQLAKQFESAFKNLGIEKIAAVGQPFDPHLHEAVSYEEDGDGEEVVVAELQAGYKMGDNVIRHSIVKVGRDAAARPPTAQSAAQDDTDEEDNEGEK
jgi:molecular chaperone GrpE